MKRSRLIIAAVLFPFLLAGAVWLYLTKQEINDAQRGEKVAMEKGCFGCHGQGGFGGILDPSLNGVTISGWNTGVKDMYVRSKKDIKEWILYGSLKDELKKDDDPKLKNLMYMPAYENYISDSELDYLVSYFIAASGWSPDMPDNVFKGWKIVNRMGCFGCHGASGMGGVFNPGSFKGYIPSFTGNDFSELVQNDQELRNWILKGKIKRLMDNPAARIFLNRQIIKMPAYNQHLSEDELSLMLIYITWLRSK